MRIVSSIFNVDSMMFFHSLNFFREYTLHAGACSRIDTPEIDILALQLYAYASISQVHEDAPSSKLYRNAWRICVQLCITLLPIDLSLSHGVALVLRLYIQHYMSEETSCFSANVGSRQSAKYLNCRSCSARPRCRPRYT